MHSIILYNASAFIPISWKFITSNSAFKTSWDLIFSDVIDNGCKEKDGIGRIQAKFKCLLITELFSTLIQHCSI